MVYLPNIPQSGDTLAASQPRILGNFQEINTDISHDHVSLTDATAAQRGKHNKVSLPRQLADPASTAIESVFYTKLNPTAPQVAAPYFHAGVGGTDIVWSIPLSESLGPIVIPNGHHTTALADFAGLPPMIGTITVYDNTAADLNRTIFSPFRWTGAIVVVPGVAGQLASGATFIRFIAPVAGSSVLYLEADMGAATTATLVINGILT